jgi:hypothetical protein
MSEVPSVVSESTAIELVRREGTARSWKANNTINAGELLWYPNASGVVQTVTFSGTRDTVLGAALFNQTSGGRVVTIKGKVQVRWDGATVRLRGPPSRHPRSARDGLKLVQASRPPSASGWGSPLALPLPPPTLGC